MLNPMSCQRRLVCFLWLPAFRPCFWDAGPVFTFPYPYLLFDILKVLDA